MESIGVEGEAEMLKGIFLPYISTSHVLPLVDIAKIFAMQGGVDATIMTTPAHAATFQSSIIRTHILNLPLQEVNAVVATSEDTPSKMGILEGQFRQALHDMKPDFIVSDMFYPWTANVAVELGIPRLVYVGGTYLSQCAMDSIQRFAPHTKVDSDTEYFLLPGLPHKLEMTRAQIPDSFREQNEFSYLWNKVKESEKKSYGTLLMSFYALEGAYEEHYKTVTGIKSWSLGPVMSWVKQDAAEKAGRGYAKEEREGSREILQGWLTWLDSKKQESVVYVCFGSTGKFNTTQLVEIAHGLEESGHDFLWVVRKIDDDDDDDDGGRGRVFLGEFEKRVEANKKGYLIWDWAPQLVILEHPAIGAVVTHCGMNSIIESVDAGLPMVTWPISAEQFFNEKLLVDVVKIGVPVGAKKWRSHDGFGDEILKRGEIGKAIALLMSGGQESVEIRKRVEVLSDAAKRAIQVCGSSYNNLKDIIQDLKSFKRNNKRY